MQNRVVYGPHTCESRGFGFVAMGPVEEAKAVVTARNATELGSWWTCPCPHTGKVLWASEA